MSNFNKELSELYKKVATDQKNKKGITHKFDRPEHANFRGKIGVNDTGIPLTPKAAIKKRNNRAGYHYPQHLKNINERRRKDAMARHGIIDVDDPFKVKPTQPAERKNFSSTWRPEIEYSKPRKKIFYGGYEPPEPEEVIYVAPPVARKAPVYKAKMIRKNNTLEFRNKLEEAIYNHPNYKKQF
tara:strand:+ start:109 stop:660 length:552 start_codon:yes stop_codon:yes gene_type:complete